MESEKQQDQEAQTVLSTKLEEAQATIARLEAEKEEFAVKIEAAEKEVKKVKEDHPAEAKVNGNTNGTAAEEEA